MLFVDETQENKELFRLSRFCCFNSEKVYPCNNCGEKTLRKKCNVIYECENCSKRYIGVSDYRLKNLERDGYIEIVKD